MANKNAWKNQPRVSKGNPDGGEWTKVEGIYNSDSELRKEPIEQSGGKEKGLNTQTVRQLKKGIRSLQKRIKEHYDKRDT